MLRRQGARRDLRRHSAGGIWYNNGMLKPIITSVYTFSNLREGEFVFWCDNVATGAKIGGRPKAKVEGVMKAVGPRQSGLDI